MKKIILFSLTAISLQGYGQKELPAIPIPMKNGIVFYEKAYRSDPLISKKERYERALEWFKRSFHGAEEKIIQADRQNGLIVGTGAFKVITSESGNYYWIKPKIAITVTDSGYTFQSYNYYEKPIEKGITNDYSKIEYRWWDYRQGKPWSPEDVKIFSGLHEGTLSLMKGLEKAENGR